MEAKSKYGCYAGLQDGTPFNGDKAEDLMELLHGMGFKRDGTRTMMSGITANAFKYRFSSVPPFTSGSSTTLPTRSTREAGRKDFLTRQPNEGRANGGRCGWGRWRRTR